MSNVGIVLCYYVPQCEARTFQCCILSGLLTMLFCELLEYLGILFKQMYSVVQSHRYASSLIPHILPDMSGCDPHPFRSETRALGGPGSVRQRDQISAGTGSGSEEKLGYT